jgi:hypothetical protein
VAERLIDLLDGFADQLGPARGVVVASRCIEKLTSLLPPFLDLAQENTRGNYVLS